MTRPLPDAARMALFVTGAFRLHSGDHAAWKIETDALTPFDWTALAEIAFGILPPFSRAEGIPRGGLPLAVRLNTLNVGPNPSAPRLIVDDVLTTGASIRIFMDRPDDIGLVVFARGPCPPRVTALFSMPDAIGGAP